MIKFNKIQLRHYKFVIISAISFIFGCMLAVNLAPINKTCRLDNTDREYNVMRNSKLKNPEIIILIVSAPNNLERRTAIRDTWLKLMDHNVRHENTKGLTHYFVIGSLGLTADNILYLSAEQSEYNDMLILPMYDNYSNLTHKIINSFVWLNEQLDVGLDFEYILKCDDDSFIRIDNLMHEIEHIEIMYIKSDISTVDEQHSPYLRINIQSNAKLNGHDLQLYWGYFNGKAEIKSSGKWKENSWILCDKYLPYALGGGYVLSKGLVRYLAKNAAYLRYYNSEDVSVGTWLASVNNVLRIHDARFDTEWTSRGCQNYYLVTHNISIKQMRRMYDNIIENGNMCDSESIKRSFYLYSWRNAPVNAVKDNCSYNLFIEFLSFGYVYIILSIYPNTFKYKMNYKRKTKIKNRNHYKNSVLLGNIVIIY